MIFLVFIFQAKAIADQKCATTEEELSNTKVSNHSSSIVIPYDQTISCHYKPPFPGAFKLCDLLFSSFGYIVAEFQRNLLARSTL